MKTFDQLTKDEQDVFIETYYDRFAGRLDTYAIRFEFGSDVVAYIPSTYVAEEPDKKHVEKKVSQVVKKIGTPEFGREAIRAHLSGQELVGGYTLRADSTVLYGALDFDRKKPDDPDPFPIAVEQARILREEAGLKVYVLRSQGGKGFHVWFLLDAPMNAGRLRHAISPFIEKVETFDRMFPNQNGVSETRPLGNLIALPLAGGRVPKGNSCFVDERTGKAHPDQFAFVAAMEMNSVALVEELFESAGQYVPEREHTKYEGDAEGLTASYKLTDERFGCEWIRWCFEHPTLVDENQWHALACQFSQFEDGRDLFHEWSAQDDQRYNVRQTDKKYDHALKQNKPHGCEAIRALGGNCECDRRFPGQVYHPFDLAKVPFKKLVESVGVEGEGEGKITTSEDGFDGAIYRLEQIQKDPEAGQGRKYGIKEIDRATRKRDADLIIIAARPGMGKTAFAGTAMDNGAIEGEPQYFFSAEMSAHQFWLRQLSARARVSQTRMATGQLTTEDWKKIKRAREETRSRAKYPIFVDDLSRSTDRIFEVAARLVHKYGKGTIWIDYLQLLQRLPRESMFDAVTRITHDLKLLAKALQCPVVALTQLNRTADDSTAESETSDSWLRGSGDIEQAADVIAFLLGQKGPGVKERIFALHKERHREAGLRINTEFNQPLMRYGSEGEWGVTMPEAEIGRRPGGAPRTDGLDDLQSGKLAPEEFDAQGNVIGMAPAPHPALKDFLAGL